MILSNKNYDEFCDAFNQLVGLAQCNDDIRFYVYNLHNKITGGATKRIFKDSSLPLEYLKVSPMNFERYVSQNPIDLDAMLSCI
tara:strand:- start:791 stop:1042 length:252 start_codon:yes stop_codon:yes gene_type:complete